MRCFSSSSSSIAARLILLTDCQQAREVMTNSLYKVGVTKHELATTGTSKGVLIDIIYSNTLSRLRRSLKLPRFMTTVGYEKLDIKDTFTTATSSTGKSKLVLKYENLSLMDIMRNFSCYTQTRPILPFEFEISPNCSYLDCESDGFTHGLKEIVIGTGSHTSPSFITSISNTRRRHKALPIYELDHGVHIRLLPSTSSYLVFSGSTIADDDGEYECIGQNNSNKGQLRILNDSDMLGVDVRMCNDNSIKPYFNEGTETLLENSLPELQNSRVLDTSLENKFSHNFGFAGDCWSEFHQMVRRPFAFVDKTETSRSKKQQQNSDRTRRNLLNVSLKE